MNAHAYDSAADTYRGVLTSLKTAPVLKADGPIADRLRRGFREELNAVITLSSPRERIVETLQIYPAVARVIWMMAANNRLADIAFHVPQVSSFTDDQLTVPGSSYGMRLRQPQPGLDQLQGAIGRLKAEADGRRAAVTIFQPLDAVRESADIPCAFGMFFHNRRDRLESTVIMRSNNAFTLLPFNLFEFSFLAEVMAVEAGLDLGPMTYFAGSMHLFEDDAVRTETLLSTPPLRPPSMKPMPRDKRPLEALNRLARFEVDLRHASEALTVSYVRDLFGAASADLGPYWSQFAAILACGVAANRDPQTFTVATQLVDAAFKPFLPKLSQKAADKSVAKMGGLFGGDVPPAVVVPLHRTKLMQRFTQLAQQHERRMGKPIGSAVLLRAQEIVADRFAARGEEDALTQETFSQALADAG
jgi:thymidylate synthase